MEENKLFVERLKELMESRGVKQSDLIRDLGINKGAMSSYLSGRYMPKNETMYSIANYLNVSPSWLAGLSEGQTTIGKQILKRRTELKLTQEELAIKLGYKNGSTINKIELGVNDISQAKIVEFANALNCSPSYLMGWEDSAMGQNELTPKEKILIDSYRKHPELQHAIDVLLGI